jgi:membrane dipeptidase
LTPPIFDGHNDTLLSLWRPKEGEERSFFARSDYGHIDLPRAQEGGLAGGFFAVFVPPATKEETKLPTEPPFELPLPEPLELGYAQQATMAMLATAYRLERAGAFHIVRSAAELEPCLNQGVLAAVLHLEGAEAIDPELNALELFYQAGVRSLGPVWSRPNAFGHGVPFKFPSSPDTGPGLTAAGRALIAACNELGIMIDLSHLNEQGFWEVAKLSRAPLVATHSNVHALCPSSRNLTDRQLDAIKDSGGMVGLNFAVSFLRADGKNDADTPLEVMVRHLDYLLARLGLDHVGLGSDFDGATVPNDIKDVTGLPKLFTALHTHGYDEAALRRLAYENWLRVLRLSWR